MPALHLDDLDQNILDHIDLGTEPLVNKLAESTRMSRQTISTRLRRLLEHGFIDASGQGRGRAYKLAWQYAEPQRFPLTGLQEDRVMREAVAPHIADLPDNVRDMWQYGITEMVNNAIDHSDGTTLSLYLRRNVRRVEVAIQDDGEGIFQRIQRLLGLFEARESIVELAKGKLTTDPSRHSGEGIYFTSRVFDQFALQSRTLHFSHTANGDWLIDSAADSPGTTVLLTLALDSTRILKTVFDEYAASEEYSFSKTRVPVRLAHHEGEKLLSRSQAKRLVARFERFQIVILDFSGIEEIGQAFADELFRVFASTHPAVALQVENVTPAVADMIRRARNA